MDNWKRIFKSWAGIPVLILAALVIVWFFIAILGIGDTSDNIKANLSAVDNNDNFQGLVTRTNNIGDTKTLPVVSPILSPSSLVSPILSLSPIPTPSKTPTLSPIPKLSTARNSGRIIINEIAWAGTSASATDEWIELYNAEGGPMDISSWQLVSSDDSPDIIFPEGTIIQTNAYFLIERSNDDTVSDITADLTVSFGQGGLNNTGEMIRLFDSEGTIVDVVGGAGETWYFGDSVSKNSMERTDPMKAGNNLSNWKSFSGTPVNKDAKGDPINGTPKAKNSTAIQVIILTPTPTPTPTLLPTPTLSPTPTPTLSPTVSPTVSPTPEPDGDVSLRTVVINEIAWMGTGSTSILSADEWIELYNSGSSQMDLTGWTLKSLTGTNPDPQVVLSGIILANDYFLLERTDDTTISNIGANQKYTGALSDSCEVLELRDNLGNIRDLISCSGNIWYAGDKDSRSSMERINPTQSGDNPANWSTNNGVIKNGLNAAGNPINGTPKGRNSACL